MCAALVFGSSSFAQQGPTIIDPLNQTAPPPAAPAEFKIETSKYFNMGMLIAAALIVMALIVKDVIWPGSFTRRKPKRDIQGLPTPAWFGCAILLFFSLTLGGAFALTALQNASDSLQKQGLAMLIAYGVGLTVCALLVYLIAPRVPNGGLKFSRKDILVGFGALLLTFPILQAVAIVGAIVYKQATGSDPDALAHKTLREIHAQPGNPWVWAMVFAAVIGAPIIEEFTYRLFVQSGVIRATRSPWLGILVTAAAFALVHRIADKPENAVPWHMIPVLFTFGVAMGIALERTGRIAVPITMHVLFNAFNITLVILGS